MSEDFKLLIAILSLAIPALLYGYIAVRDVNKKEQKEKKS